MPLIINDPYISFWSTADRLNADTTRHWSGAVKPLNGFLRVDGTTYRFMGQGDAAIAKAEQKGYAQVMACNTYYHFACGPVGLDLVFTAPMAMDDLDMLSTPVNYVSYRVRSLDGKRHKVQLMLTTTPELTVNSASQPTLSRLFADPTHGLSFLRAGSKAQRELSKTATGDLVCIDWGYLYLPDVNGSVAIGSQDEVMGSFSRRGRLPRSKQELASSSEGDMPALAYAHDFGQVRADSSYMLIAYDEVHDVEYLGTRYKGYWARSGKTIAQAMAKYRDRYDDYMQTARRWDRRIYDDALAVGNDKYAEVLSLSYRQALGAHKLFQDKDGGLKFFSKEDNSGGLINTVDVFYPASPLMLLYNISLLKASLDGIFEYCADTARWGFAFPAHDIGLYPYANGQRYSICKPDSTGGFGRNMPVEEAGNMVVLAAMISIMDGNADYASYHWADLTRWTDYLIEKGMDPEDQLCTDDFAGRSRHNTNLSLKAIMGVAGYAIMAQQRGEADTYNKYMTQARSMAKTWENEAEAGTHWKRTFDNSASWSLKYNMIWDKLWGTHLFDSSKVKRELGYYLAHHAHSYGIPLDDRKDYTKSDWESWIAAMADTREEFCALHDMVWNFANATPTRVPFSDWYYTTTGRWASFRARSVVGGHWMRVLLKACKRAGQR